jgi:hypothetical protein
MKKKNGREIRTEREGEKKKERLRTLLALQVQQYIYMNCALPMNRKRN